jgi:ubiquinone/menaquinone biosynthesis C-methylase UbiE
VVSADKTPQGWDTTAGKYDSEITPHLELYAANLLRCAGVTPGHHVLDVAAGPGAVTFRAARMGAKVTAIDFSPGMLALLERRRAALGLAGIAARVMDGQALEFPDDTFDRAVSNFGLIFFPDRARGLREMLRVLKPGGKGAITAWSLPARTRFISVFSEAARAALPHMPPPKEKPAVYSLQDPVQLKGEMAAAGFKDVKVITVDHTWTSSSPEDHWDRLSQSSPVFTQAMSRATKDERAALRQKLIDILRAEFGDGPVALGGEAHIGVGAKG